MSALLVVAMIVSLLGSTILYNRYMAAHIDPKVYTPLLDTIARGESNGNYNAYFGNAGNTEIIFTSMTVKQVLDWQEAYVKQGSPSSAVGKYQIIRPTLVSLVERLGIDTSATFDTKLQDRMAVALLEKRGAQNYVLGHMPRDEFAANLAKEWAALPRIKGPKPEQSYYAGDGLNHVRISIDEVYKALAAIRP